MALINTLHFADCHLESDAVSTLDTIRGIESIIHEVPPETLDVISFSGDVFDKAIIVPASKLPHIVKFASRLIKYALKHNILLRFLEGTPSHDRKQSELFVALAEAMGATHLVEYFPELTLHHEPTLGINVLYVPDALNHDNAVTLRQAQALLKKNGLTKVDMMATHGSFKYQVGLILSRPHHLEQPWMDMCRFYIVNGHVHGMSTYGGIILVPGSTNRTCHGEERAKGAILTTINTETGDKSWKFLENKHATIFKTEDVKGFSLESIITLIESLIETKQVVKGSNLRLMMNAEDDGVKSFAKLRIRFPTLKLKREVKTPDKEEKETVDIRSEVKGVSITYTNLADMLSTCLLLEEGESPNEYMTLLNTHLEKCKNGVRIR